jgi:hypothetical protein
MARSEVKRNGLEERSGGAMTFIMESSKFYQRSV